MKLNLIRTTNTPNYCHGKLYVSCASMCNNAEAQSAGDFLICDTLEPPVGTNGQGQAIPAGTYRLGLTMSPRFGRMLPLVCDVPRRSGIRIHRGNTAADTSGCILPGKYVGNGRLTNSTPRESDIVKLLQSDDSPHFIEVIDLFAQPMCTSDGDEQTACALQNRYAKAGEDSKVRSVMPLRTNIPGLLHPITDFLPDFIINALMSNVGQQS